MKFSLTQLFIISLVTLFLYHFLFGRSNNREQIFLLLILLCVFLAGKDLYDRAITETIFENHYDSTVEVLGEVVAEPSFGSFSDRYQLKIKEIRAGPGLQSKFHSDEKIIISKSKYPIYQMGDILRVSGKIEKPENFENENGIEFDYINFLAKDNIHGIISYARVTLVGSNKFRLSRILFSIKNGFLEKLGTVLESPHSELMGGLLLGVKQSLGDELENQFRIAGLIHVVVLSGYNITIIIVATFGFLSFLPLKIKYFLGLVFVMSFAIMVGAGATVMRASLMAFLVIVGKYSHKNYNINKSLFFAGFIMLLSNPLILFYDPSFQLSFVASLGLVNFSGALSRILRFLPEKFEFREIVSATTSTQIAVLPMILSMTGELSVVSLPANLIVLPMIPVTMLLGPIQIFKKVINVLTFPARLVVGHKRVFPHIQHQNRSSSVELS
jgi:competence protein ComEC